MEQPYLKSIDLKGIHKRYDLNLDFNENLNILYGQNGTGKSTLIHVIANVVNCDFIRFLYLDFEKVTVIYSDEQKIEIERNESDGLVVSITLRVNDSNELIFSKNELPIEQEKTDWKDGGHFGSTGSYFITETGEVINADAAPDRLQKLENFVEKNKLNKVGTSYFPAFRTMLEAWSSQQAIKTNSPRGRKVAREKITDFSRKLFGQFLPKINFPSPLEIESGLKDDIRAAQLRIARYESSVFSDSFVKVFSALIGGEDSNFDANELLSEIAELSKTSGNSKLGNFGEESNAYGDLRSLVGQEGTSISLQSSAAGALAVYRDALKQRKQEQQNAFKEIDKYFEVVNTFLDKKELSYELDTRKRVPRVGLKFPDNTWSRIQVMSSGERQLLTMLYAVNKMSGNSIVLIDEPELSLHIDWQEELLGKMMEQLGDRQIIVCTHSPSIAADFDEYMKEVAPVFTAKSPGTIEDDDDDEGIF